MIEIEDPLSLSRAAETKLDQDPLAEVLNSQSALLGRADDYLLHSSGRRLKTLNGAAAAHIKNVFGLIDASVKNADEQEPLGVILNQDYQARWNFLATHGLVVLDEKSRLATPEKSVKQVRHFARFAARPADILSTMHTKDVLRWLKDVHHLRAGRSLGKKALGLATAVVRTYS